MKRLVAAAAVVIALYVYLALLSPRVFDVLVYDESKLTPPFSSRPDEGGSRTRKALGPPGWGSGR